MISSSTKDELFRRAERELLTCVVMTSWTNSFSLNFFLPKSDRLRIAFSSTLPEVPLNTA